MLPRYYFSWFGFRLTCARFARILFRGGYVYRKSILEDIIIHFDLITKLLDPREKYWPIGRINKHILVDQSLNHLEVFCNISRGILKQETLQLQSVSSQNLVHNGSVFLYFFSGTYVFFVNLVTEYIQKEESLLASSLLNIICYQN